MALKNGFELSPVFCLHNGAVVLDRNDERITFGLLNGKNLLLKRRLESALEARRRGDEKRLSARFIDLDRDEFNIRISAMLSEDEKSAEKNASDSETSVSENEAEIMLDALIGNAASDSATDIHIDGNYVRFRIGGRLSTEMELPVERKRALVQRIKLLGNMNVVENRRGQDGSFVHRRSDGKKIFVRVSCVPTVGQGDGDESVVLRLLDPERMPLKIDSLGFSENQCNILRKFCRLENGLVLICGATGSGKSTTAAALLEEIRRQEGDCRKIVSMEDPVEYILEGVSQVRVNEGQGNSFHEVLKRTLRQDPDVIFIGEIRDEETACIAVQAAMTGHLVFATLHTGTVTQAILRMYDLGAAPKMVNSVLRGVVAQHLIEGKMSARIQEAESMEYLGVKKDE